MSARVLVVDDIPVNVRLLEAKLFTEYYEVLIALDGPTALEIVKQESPDIVLLDVMMPGMDGYEVCHTIKTDPETAHIPVVMVSALNETSDRVRGLEAGADDFLTKPVSDIALFSRIRSLVRLKNAIDELRAREATELEFGPMEDRFFRLDDRAPGDILLVARESWDRRMITATLEDFGHRLTVVQDFADAMGLAAEGDFHLVLVNDVDDDSALRFCSQLRSRRETRHGPILLAVDDGNEARLAKAMELGINDYLVRPINKDELIARTQTQIRRKRYEERLRTDYRESVNAAVTDSLTGMYNRRYLTTYFGRVVKRLGVASKQISILMLDIDHFKSVNDVHGHSAGDEVLKAMGKIILGNLRGSDTAVRYGGEEFIVLMPDVSVKNASAAAERLRRWVSETPFSVAGTDEDLAVTVSIGVAATLAGSQSLEVLIKRADAALYEAKDGGRNRVSEASDVAPAQDPAKQAASG